MNDSNWRISIKMTMYSGEYRYTSVADKEFDISAPLALLKQIDISGVVADLYHDTLLEGERAEQEQEDA